MTYWSPSPRAPRQPAGAVGSRLAVHGWPAAVGGRGGSPLLRAAAAEEYARRGLFLETLIAVNEVLAPTVIALAPELAQARMAPFPHGTDDWRQGLSPGAPAMAPGSA
ncbi:acyl-CoA dehydrogenase family protein [Parafrankia sp. EUN1f]|uniref:acyl-CoA dehydrogenase family protein n=1 Tax=Parafrankia sp. EUN1f TaxID=102897 RepID=UPI0001C45B5E|nr:acyl-CoA dehydrogenase family protein [Parafrankia sp. EUN1f]EFC81671.1 hypothetical protein FrEUN1fDRAFT_5208 [Parafrankia sp. EUN1f]